MKKLLFVLVAFCSLSAQAQNFSNALKKLTEKVVSIPIQTQTSVKGSDDKELEKQAKNGDAQAQCDIGKRYFSGEDVKFDLKKAKKWFKMAADQGNGEAMYYLSRVAVMENDGSWKDLVEKAANAGYGVAQYEQYQSTGDKQWLQKAADNGHPDALYEVAKMTDDASERLKLLEKAAAQGNSLAQSDAGLLRKQVEEEQERLRKEKEAKQRAEQMKAIEEGRLLPSYDFVEKNIRTLAPNQSWMLSLCKEDVLAYTGRNNMDGLDKSLYLKSEDYQTDLNSLQEDRNSVFAYMHNLRDYGERYNPNKEFGVEFEADAMTFNCLNIKNETNLEFAHIGIGQIAFPIQPVVTKAEWASGYYYFPCSDIYALKKVKDNLGHIAFVILFKPAFAKEISSANIFLRTTEVGVVNPIAMYIVDKQSGEVLLNLSEYIRDISSETGYKAEMALIENINKKEKALQDKWDREYREAEAKKTYHKVPKEERCWVCGGSGTITSDGVPIKRCTNCYGRGYTLEHYY